MDDEYRIVFIQHEDDLQKPSLGGRTPDEKFLIRLRERIRRTGPSHNLLGFLRFHAVRRDVSLVPLAPAEFHG
jgi:hypothetical protein